MGGEKKKESGTHCLRMLSSPTISVNSGHFHKICSVTLIAQNGHRNHSSPCRVTISGSVGSFQSGGAFAGQRALTTTESSLMSGCG